MDDATTPTRATFGALASQRPLPAQPFPAALSIPQKAQSEEKQSSHPADSQYSNKSRGAEDHDMDDSDDGVEGGEDGSDDESVNADGTRSKKKRSQRFYCTEYPPCTLSFTRSEHLARHIRYEAPQCSFSIANHFRKHTGERPFQCHCSRRFSRLDNLRQHSQTVHVNEEIPPESLAATGTRFQRQVRTDRVRPPGSRSRASTSGSQAVPVRGHHRNSLSASSISSVGSAFSTRDDARRRPPPLQMAGSGVRSSQEIIAGYRPDSPNQYQYQSHSPGVFSTPTSATFSTEQNSPRWGSAMQSPSLSHSRTASIYQGHRTPGRRLSVPSAQNPFQSPHGYGPSSLSNMNSSNMGAFSPASSMMNSPTTSTNSGWAGRRESTSSAADEAWRRRTWHPDTHSSGFTSSRLQNITTNYYSTGPPPQVPVLPSNAPPLQSQNAMRLPGIESFDPLPRPTTPVRRQPSPMMIDTPSRVSMPLPNEQHQERSNSQHWDMGINRNLNRLDIQGTPPSDAAGSWANETNRAVLAHSDQARAQPAVRFEESPYSARTHAQNLHYSAPPITPKEVKRQGWYQGPPPTMGNIDPRIQRTSPADSSGSEAGIPGTPSSANVGEFNPSIVHSNGYIEARNGFFVQNPPVVPSNAPNAPIGYSTYQPQRMNGIEQAYTYSSHHQTRNHMHDGNQGQVPKSSDNGMSKLDALVAVATSEENVAAAY